MGLSQRDWGSEYLPKFRSIARELNMTPQNLHYLWKNRKDIISRAKNSLPNEVMTALKNNAIKKTSPILNQIFMKDIKISASSSLKDLSKDITKLLDIWYGTNEISKM